MIVQKGKLWAVQLGDKEQLCVSKETAEAVLKKYNPKPDPLKALAKATSPVFEEVEEECLIEDEEE